jgi:hypothetical protein
MAGLRDILERDRLERQRQEDERRKQAEANADAFVRRMRKAPRRRRVQADLSPESKHLMERVAREIAQAQGDPRVPFRFSNGRTAYVRTYGGTSNAAVKRAAEGVERACQLLREGFESLAQREDAAAEREDAAAVRERAAAKRERFMMGLAGASVVIASLPYLLPLLT